MQNKNTFSLIHLLITRMLIAHNSLQHVISEEENQESKVASPKDSEVPEISTKKTKWKRFLERQSSRDILSFSSLDLGKVPHLSKQDLTKSLTINNASKSGLR